MSPLPGGKVCLGAVVRYSTGPVSLHILYPFSISTWLLQACNEKEERLLTLLKADFMHITDLIPFTTSDFGNAWENWHRPISKPGTQMPWPGIHCWCALALSRSPKVSLQLLPPLLSCRIIKSQRKRNKRA